MHLRRMKEVRRVGDRALIRGGAVGDCNRKPDLLALEPAFDPANPFLQQTFFLTNRRT